MRSFVTWRNKGVRDHPRRRIVPPATTLAEVQSVIDDWFGDNASPRVLDAGCGNRRYVDLPADAHIVGVDADKAQLESNPSIHERVLGDIQTLPLPKDDFNLILCWDVLEHLPRPQDALENLAQALAPNGLLVLGGPNLFSLKGLVTKLTPYWFHRAYYRRHTSLTPFRTHLRLPCAPQMILEWAHRKQLRQEYLAFCESPAQVDFRRTVRLVGRAWSTLVACSHLMTRGAVDPAATDFVLVLRRCQPVVHGMSTTTSDVTRAAQSLAGAGR